MSDSELRWERFPETPSGTQQAIGFHIDWAPGSGRARCSLDLQAGHINRRGAMHGGLMVLLMDTACGVACEAADPDDRPTVATVDIHTQFIANTGEGVVVAEARVVRAGRRIAFVAAELHDEQGRLLATASATFALRRTSQPDGA